MVSGPITGYVPANTANLVESSFIGGLIRPQGLISTGSINGLSVANTNLFTVPAGKVVLVTSVILRLSTAVALVGTMTAGVGVNVTADDIYGSQALTAFNATNEYYMFTSNGNKRMALGGENILLGIDTAFTGTSAVIIYYLFGLIDNQ